MIRNILERIKKIFSRKVVIISLVLGLLLVFFVWYGFRLQKRNLKIEEVVEDEVIEIEEVIEDEVEEIIEVKELYYVDVKGAVNQPGVYALEVGKRVKDAIEIAGGLRDDADTSLINLARVIFDEMVVVIYTRDEVIRSNTKFEINTSVNDAYKNVSDNNVDNVGDDSSSDDVNKLININTASIDELVSLSGIGQSKAEAIISYREENGNFSTIEDILNVSGIGSSVFEKIKNDITV